MNQRLNLILILCMKRISLLNIMFTFEFLHSYILILDRELELKSEWKGSSGFEGTEIWSYNLDILKVI